MNTMLHDRLFSDPRLRHLARELGCPLKAIGALAWLWHGSQNVGLSVLDECSIRDTLPLGVRGPGKVLLSLEHTGWIQKCEGGYRVVGNDDHVQVRKKIIKGAKNGAAKRWGKNDALGIGGALPSDMPTPEKEHAPSMLTSPLLTSPHLTHNTTGSIQDEEHPSRKAIGRTPLDHIAEHAWRDREKSRGLPGLSLSEGDRARLGRILGVVVEAQKANAKVTIETVFDEWLQPAWAQFYGDSLKQLENNLRSVINVVVHPANRPAPRGTGATKPERFEPKVPNYHTGEADRIANLKWEPRTAEEKAAAEEFRKQFEATPDPLAGVL